MKQKRKIAWILTVVLFLSVLASSLDMQTTAAAAGSAATEENTIPSKNDAGKDETVTQTADTGIDEETEKEDTEKEDAVTEQPPSGDDAGKTEVSEPESTPTPEPTPEPTPDAEPAKEAMEDTEGADAALKTEVAETSDQIKIVNADEALVVGWQATYEADTTLPEDGLTLQWQVSEDGENWMDLEDQRDWWYSFEVTEETFSRTYRVVGNYTDPQTQEVTAYASAVVQPVRAVCYVEKSGKASTRATDSRAAETYAELAEAFKLDGWGNDNRTITITQNIVLNNAIEVYAAKGVASYTNTYLLKSGNGGPYTISTDGSFVGNMFLHKEQGVVKANSEVVLQNINIAGYKVDDNGGMVEGSSQASSIFQVSQGKGWVYVQGGTTLLNPGKKIVDIVGDGKNTDYFKINGLGVADESITKRVGPPVAGPIKMIGEVAALDREKVSVYVFGNSANLTQDSNVSLTSAASGSNGTIMAVYQAAMLPTEVAYFRLGNPGSCWMVANKERKDLLEGTALEVSKDRPSTIYVGEILADGTTPQNNIYAKGIHPDAIGTDTSSSAVSSLLSAYAKIRQLNLDPEAKGANLALVSTVTLAGSNTEKGYTFTPTSFTGEGQNWSWEKEIEIQRYYRPDGKTILDPGYTTDNFKGTLLQIPKDSTLTLDGIIINGKPASDVKEGAQAALITVEGQGTLTLQNGGSLKDNANTVKGAETSEKGGGVYLKDNAIMNLNDGAAIIGNSVSAEGRGAGIYEAGYAQLNLKGNYKTDAEQEIWLGARIQVQGPFTTTGTSAIPVDFETYMAPAGTDGSYIAYYNTGSPSIMETDKFQADQDKMAEKNLYIGYTGQNILLKEKSGTMSFGFTKQDVEGKVLSDTAFKLYECKYKGSEEESGHTTHDQYADIYGNDPNNCWREIAQRVSGAKGEISFGVLADGEYRLAEMSAPYPWNVPEGQWKLGIDSDAEKDQDKVKLTFLPKGEEGSPVSLITLNTEKTGTDSTSTWIKNRKGATTNFVTTLETADKKTAMADVTFELYVCRNWRNPAHHHENIATDELAVSGECWQKYTQDNVEGQYTTDGKGKLSIPELMDGDYMLKQVTAVAGYQLPQGQWMIRVRSGEDPSITITGKKADTSNSLPQYSVDTDGSIILYNVSEVEPLHQKYIKHKGGEDYTLTLDVTGKDVPQMASPNPVSVLFIVEATSGTASSVDGMNIRQREKEIVTELSKKILTNNEKNEVAIVSYGRVRSVPNITEPYSMADVVSDWTNDLTSATTAITQMKYGDDKLAPSNWEAGFRLGKTMFGLEGSPAKYYPKRTAPRAGNDRRIVFLTYTNADSFYSTNYYGTGGITPGGGTTPGYWTETQSQGDAALSGFRGYQDYARPVAIDLVRSTGAVMDIGSLSSYHETTIISSGGYGTEDQKRRVGGQPVVLATDLRAEAGANFKASNWYKVHYQRSPSPSYPQLAVSEEDARKTLYDQYESYVGTPTTQNQVIITDTLSEYVDKVDKTSFTVTAKNVDGNPVDLSGVKIKTAYDSATKKVTVTFPENYPLVEGTTYSISFDIKVNDTAYNEYAKKGYNAVGDEGTDAPNNDTSSGKAGFFSNESATLEYMFNEQSYTAPYAKPVVQVPVAEWSLHKSEAGTNTSIAGVGFALYQKIGDTAADTAPGDGWRLVQDKMITDSSGNLILPKVKSGVYRLVETDTPLGYQKPTAQWELTVTVGIAGAKPEVLITGSPTDCTYDPASGILTVFNTKLQSMRFNFYKVDGTDTTILLADVVFELYRWNGTELPAKDALVTEDSIASGDWKLAKEVTSQATIGRDENGSTIGNVDFGQIPEGIYTLVETKTNPGYQLPMGQWRVMIKRNAVTSVVYIESMTAVPSKGKIPPAIIKDADATGGTGIITTIYKLPNFKETWIPFTGSVGIFRYILMGGIFIAMAIMLFLFSKKRGLGIESKKNCSEGGEPSS